jgi:hypothetical protein
MSLSYGLEKPEVTVRNYKWSLLRAKGRFYEKKYFSRNLLDNINRRFLGEFLFCPGVWRPRQLRYIE